MARLRGGASAAVAEVEAAKAAASRKGRGLKQEPLPGVNGKVTEGQAAGGVDGVARRRTAKTGPDGETPEDGAPPLGQEANEATDYERGLAEVIATARGYVDRGEKMPLPQLREPYPVPCGIDFALNGHTQDYLKAPDLEMLFSYVATVEQERFSHLNGVGIDWLWALEGGVSKGTPILGRTTLARKKLRFYSGITYVIEAAADHLDAMGATWGDVLDVIRHEALHTGTRDGKHVLRGHEFEGFLCELDGERTPRHLREIPQQMGLDLKW